MSNLLSSELQENDELPNHNGKGILDLLIVLAKHKWLVFGLPFAVAVCVALVSLRIPNSYKAVSQILPPQQSQSSTAAAMLNQLGGLAGPVSGALGIKNPNELYIGLFSSRTIADKLIARFDLKKYYKQDKLEKTRKVLQMRTNFIAGKNNLITIEVEDKDPKFAATLANAYVEELSKLLNTLAVTEASQRRIFFERELKKVKNQLTDVESTLKSSLQTKGVVSIDGQSRAIVEMTARLRAQITAKEIQLASMRAFVTTDNQEYKRSYQDLISMRSELDRLENGVTRSGDQREGDADKKTGLNNVKLLRDVKYNQMLYEMLAKQYEIARLDEAKDAPVIQVLDKAIEPETKSKPNRTRMVVTYSVITLFLALLWVFIKEGIRSNREPEFENKMGELKSLLRFRKR